MNAHQRRKVRRHPTLTVVWRNSNPLRDGESPHLFDRVTRQSAPSVKIAAIPGVFPESQNGTAAVWPVGHRP